MNTEIWIMIDEDGSYAIGTDADAAAEAFEENVGGSGPRRLVCIKAYVPLPKPLICSVNVPETAGETVTAEAV